MITDNSKVNINLIKENEELRAEIRRLKKTLSSIAKLEKERWSDKYKEIMHRNLKEI